MFGKKEVPAHDHEISFTNFVVCNDCGVLVQRTKAQCVEVIRGPWEYAERGPISRNISSLYYCNQHRKNYDRVMHRSPSVWNFPGENTVQYLRRVKEHYDIVEHPERKEFSFNVEMVFEASEAPKPKRTKKGKTKK